MSPIPSHIKNPSLTVNSYNLGRSGTPKLSFDRYDVMSKALNATGRPILYAMCNWGNDDPYDWAYDIANSYRMSGDIYDSFNRPDSRCPCDDVIGCKWPGFHCSVMNILNKMGSIVSRTMSGSFADSEYLLMIFHVSLLTKTSSGHVGSR